VTDVDPARKRRARAIAKVLAGLYPDSRTALVHASPYQLLVGVVLAAQCTDVRVNTVTPRLFARYPTPADLAVAVPAELEEIVRPAGFFRNKAKNLIAAAQAIVAEHDGDVPADLAALVKLPGVGRKTAHCVLGSGFSIPSGVVVDTHVLRLSRRMGLTDSDDPVRIEHELNAMLPKTEWIAFSHRIIDHGRAVCVARRPRCEICPVAKLCPKVGVAADGRPIRE